MIHDELLSYVSAVSLIDSIGLSLVFFKSSVTRKPAACNLQPVVFAVIQPVVASQLLHICSQSTAANVHSTASIL